MQKFNQYLESMGINESWKAELHDQAVEALVDIVDGLFGPGGYNFPDEDEIIAILREAVNNIF